MLWREREEKLEVPEGKPDSGDERRAGTKEKANWQGHTSEIKTNT